MDTRISPFGKENDERRRHGDRIIIPISKKESG